MFAQETTPIAVRDEEATIKSLFGDTHDSGTDGSANSGTDGGANSDTDGSANSGTNGGALDAAVEEAALADTVNAATHSTPLAVENEESRRQSRFGKNDEDILHRMADVFQFGFNGSRSRCTSVDSGDLARRKGDSEDFGESLPNSGTLKTTDKAGRGF